jgi:hypothetical protein
MFYLEKFQLYFSQFLVINTLDPDLGPDSLEIKNLNPYPDPDSMP